MWLINAIDNYKIDKLYENYRNGLVSFEQNLIEFDRSVSVKTWSKDKEYINTKKIQFINKMKSCEINVLKILIVSVSVLSPTRGEITYVLKLGTEKYYMGKTANLENRLNEHKNGDGSEFTKKDEFIKLLQLDTNNITKNYIKFLKNEICYNSNDWFNCGNLKR